MTLVEFLLARIAEDESVATDASQGDYLWIQDASSGSFRFVKKITPVRVLAECEAKRRIVTLEWHEDGGDDDPYVLRLLALPYADHPDYRQEWRP